MNKKIIWIFILGIFLLALLLYGIENGAGWYILGGFIICIAIILTLFFIKKSKRKKEKQLKIYVLEKESQQRKERQERKEKMTELITILDNTIRRKTFCLILDKLHIYLNDKSLVKICYNFIAKNNGLPTIDYLINYHDKNLPQHDTNGKNKLYPYITIEAFQSFIELDCSKKSEISNMINISNYIFKNDTFLWKLTTSYLNKNLDLSIDNDTDISFEADNNEFIYTFNDKILKFIKLLYNNDKINNNIVDKQAILYLLWIINKNYLISLLNGIYEQYNISNTMTMMDKVEKIYSIYNEEAISILFIEDYLKNLDKPLLVYYNENIKKIKSYIKIIQNKEKLKRIENYDESESLISLSEIDIMTGGEFENFIANWFNNMGYTTKITKASGDQGIDVLARKHNFTIAIQAKCYSGVVGNHAIMEAVAGMKYYNADKCMVITNRTFTKSAVDLAKANNVELWDRFVLKEKLNLK